MTTSPATSQPTPDPGTEREYEALWSEYQAVMHRGAWRIGWGLFAVLVGLLPMMWLFIWMVGPGNWEKTLFHAPVLMWLAAPLCLVLVVALVLKLYRKNLELDATKQVYLRRLRALQAAHPELRRQAPPRPAAPSGADPDAFRDDD
jgi:hypothetical protein